MMDPFLSQLADLCRAHPTRAKWVFVPTHVVGNTIGDRLARQGVAWVNLRFVTPLDVAIRMAGPFLVERSIEPSEESLGPALVMRLLASLSDEHAYFKPMAEHTSLAFALWATLRELRFAGLLASDLAADAFPSAAKGAELAALVRAYEQHLEAMHVADMAAVFKDASRFPQFCPIGADDVVIEMPDVIWAPVVRSFLDGLPGTRVRARTLALPGTSVPARCERLAGAVDRVGPEAANGAARLRFLRAPALAGQAVDDGSLVVFHAGGHEAEIAEVFRRIFASGRPLDEIEIACASDELSTLAWEKAVRIGWPVTVSGGLPVATTRPGRALLRWCDWIEDEFSAGQLRRLLDSGDLSATTFGDPEAGDARLSTGRAARLLLKAETAWGRDTYRLTLSAMLERDRRRGKDDDTRGAWRAQRAQQVSRLLAWIDARLADVPESDAEGRVALAQMITAATRFLETSAARAGELDAAGFVALREALDGLRALGDYRCPLSLALRFLREAVESTGVGRHRPRPGHLHVSRLRDAGYDGRPLVFVVGLEEAGVFPRAMEDPVLLDTERAVISTGARLAVPLATTADRVGELVHATLARLAAIGCSAQRVTLSFSCRDTRGFRDTFPSWLILQVERIRTGDPTLVYDSLQEMLGEPASAVPGVGDIGLTDAAWWLRASRAGAPAVPQVLDTFPALARGRQALEARASDELTVFDGFVEEAGRVLDLIRAEDGVSPTALEGAAGCPFRYFLERGLRVAPIESGERDADVWLDPLVRGGELHALYAALVRRVRAENRRVSGSRDRDWFLAAGRARLEELARAMPPPSAVVRVAESEEFLRDLEVFVDELERETGADPIGVEVAFGRALDDAEPEPLARREPVRVPLGKRRALVLTGRVDRVDRIRKHEYRVVDYKTGRFWRGDWAGTFAAGTQLQHALYSIAIEELLREGDSTARVVGAEYAFPTGRGWGQRVFIARPSAAQLAEVLEDLVDVIASGTFTQAGDKDACRFCQHAAACGREPWHAAARKQEANVGNRLAAWARLQGRE